MGSKETRLFPVRKTASSGEKSRVSSPHRNFLSYIRIIFLY
ncbi:Uncharacterized protein dnm_088760 [Desulfonema magnum]|uniref:Uncharacterized protein n=1 Tax=Desulfonema magnum TaxID=45655 RepID=A0A975GT72_9BACT|nr:Uncharacterized protein dnm_088760 [Desulfonema magnum]